MGNHSKADIIYNTPTPYWDALLATYPHSQLLASGEDVGLPDGQMGNSEVGHLNIGAGRVVYQDLVKINRACADNSILKNPEVIEAFKMYQKTTKNKDQFKKILLHAIHGERSSILDTPATQEWTTSLSTRIPGITKEGFAHWLEKNEKMIQIGAWAEKANLSKDLIHFTTIANTKLKTMGLQEQADAGKLVNYFDTFVKPKVAELKWKSSLDATIFDTFYADLLLQVQSIKNVQKTWKAKEITSITIYRETNPLNVTMMWNWVDGSCLSFYSSVWNYWSAATNALDINKGVFYIKDQTGNIIGRVLTAIDDHGKMLRFHLYKKWNIEIDLDTHIDTYLKEIAQKSGLWLNGDIEKVKLLNGDDWYRDPVREFGQ